MKTRFRSEDEDWTAKGRKITAPEVLEAIRRCLEDEGPVIVEHGFYRGSCAPDRLVFDSYEEFVEYLDSRTFAGTPFTSGALLLPAALTTSSLPGSARTKMDWFPGEGPTESSPSPESLRKE